MHEEALTKEGTVLLPRFERFEGFYLVGGTSLALQIGHRLSVDFDFFTQEEFQIQSLLQKVKRVFSGLSVATTYRAPGQLNLLINRVQTTFFHYPYPVLDPFALYQRVPLAGIREIAAMKAIVLGKRLSYKDYVDWYFLIKEKHVVLGDIITFSQKKFGRDFNDRLFLGQLSSLRDIPFQKIDFLRNAVEQDIIQSFLDKAVQKYVG